MKIDVLERTLTFCGVGPEVTFCAQSDQSHMVACFEAMYSEGEHSKVLRMLRSLSSGRHQTLFSVYNKVRGDSFGIVEATVEISGNRSTEIVASDDDSIILRSVSYREHDGTRWLRWRRLPEVGIIFPQAQFLLFEQGS